LIIIEAAVEAGTDITRRDDHRGPAWPAGTLREGLDDDAACATYAVLCNIDTYRVMTEEHGWPPERVQGWWLESLSRLLLR